MDAIAVPLMLSLAAVAFVTALGGIIGFVLETYHYKPASYWWRILGGICFISQAFAGAVAVGYISERRIMTSIIVVILVLLGSWLLNFGLRLRQKALSEN